MFVCVDVLIHTKKAMTSNSSELCFDCIQNILFRFGVPAVIAFGTISSLLNLIVFSQKNLRKSSFSIYFMAFDFSNLFLLYTSFLMMSLDLGFQINMNFWNSFSCRLRYYFGFVFEALSGTYLVMASIDRVWITSGNMNMRRRSTTRTASIAISLAAIFWILFHSHILIFNNVFRSDLNTTSCFLIPNWYPTFIGIYASMKSTLTTFLSALFAVWTLKNLRAVRRLTYPINNRLVNGKLAVYMTAKDRQLVLIMLMDIFMFFIFGLGVSTFLLYQQITRYNMKNEWQKRFDRMLGLIVTVMIYLPYCISFYVHVLFSKGFRIAVKTAVRCRR